MSIYIKLKGKAPRSCAECDRDLAYFAGCIYTQRLVLPSEHDMNVGRHHLCPLIELPPHGRLIDADALVREWPHGFVKTSDVIANAQTIIPAEGGDANARESRISVDDKRPYGGR